MASRLTSSFPQVRLYSLMSLGVIGIILGGLSASLAKTYGDASSYFYGSYSSLRNAAGLLAFDGLFIFFWSIVLIILTLFIKDHHSGFMKWLVGPLGLTIQLAILWVLVLAGAGALSDKQGGLDCSYSSGTDCNVANASLAFGWILWIAISVVLGVLVFVTLKTPRAEGGFSRDGATSTISGKQDLEHGAMAERSNGASTSTPVTSVPAATAPTAPNENHRQGEGVNHSQPQASESTAVTGNETYQMPQPTHHQA